jgi:preprotein translocase subunit SecF
VGVAALFIMIYISFAFRLMTNSMRLGVAAIVAALHDVIITLGAFSILGKVIDLEVNAMFITGILTVVGYSVHDTIVVFDRIRENTARRVSRDMGTTINISIMETVGRSLTTSLTTLTVIVALLLMGGGTIESLLYTLLIGVIVGTYSSIAIASQLLLVWEERGMMPFRRREEAEA